jgi:hypothetical protein
MPITLLRTRSIYLPTASDGIDFSGATDTSLAVQNFLGRIPDGATARFPAAAILGFNDGGHLFVGNKAAFQVVQRHNFVVDGNGCQCVSLSLGDPHRYTWFIGGGSAITITNFGDLVGSLPFYAGSATDFEFQAPIWMEGVVGCEITGNTATQSMGYFVEVLGDQNGLNGGTAVNPSTNVTIDSNTFNGQFTGSPGVPPQGIAVECTAGLVISNNTIENVGANAIDIEPNATTWPCHDIVIDRNTFHGCNTGLIACASSQISGATTYNVTVSNNTLDTTPTTCANGISFASASGNPHINGLVIKGNAFWTLARSIALTACDGFLVDSNTCHQAGGGGCTNTGNPSAVMYADHCTSGTVTNNTEDGGLAPTWGIFDPSLGTGVNGATNGPITRANNTGWPVP